MASEFDIIEASNSGGKPIRLYEFSRGSAVWRYNSSDRDILRLGQLWKGGEDGNISDSGIKQSGEAEQDDITVTLPSTSAIAALFSSAFPSSQVWMKIRDTHEGIDECEVSWVGTVTDVKKPQQGTMSFTCQSIAVSLNRTGLRLTWSRSCPYALYDPRTCRVPASVYRVGFQATVINGIVVGGTSSQPYAPGYFSGGYIEWVSYKDPTGQEDVMESRGIEYWSGYDFRLLGTPDGLKSGDFFYAYPGCNRTILECNSKFFNYQNYGGVPGLPGKSPFDGNPVF